MTVLYKKTLTFLILFELFDTPSPGPVIHSTSSAIAWLCTTLCHRSCKHYYEKWRFGEKSRGRKNAILHILEPTHVPIFHNSVVHASAPLRYYFSLYSPLVRDLVVYSISGVRFHRFVDHTVSDESFRKSLCNYGRLSVFPRNIFQKQC